MIENILGSKVNIRIMRLLLSYPNKDFLISEIEKYTGAKGGNLYRALRKLKTYGIIIKNSNLYRVNFSHQLIQSLNSIFEKEKKYFQNIDQKELNIISDLTNELLKHYTDIEDIILFGSVSRGMYSDKSDLDLMVIKQKTSNRIELDVAKIRKKYARKIQLFFHTPKEFNESKEPLIKEVKREGISITSIFSGIGLQKI